MKSPDGRFSSASDRYVRQSQFAPIGEAGQSRLQDATVAVMGCGALGSVAAELLVRSGIGRLRLIDRDLVEWSNLQRQSLYDEADAIAGAAKAEAAAIHLKRINSLVQLDEIVMDVTPANINEAIGDADLVVDASDNFSLRLLLNDYALDRSTPWVHGGCVGATGQVRLFHGAKPCFRCLVPEIPDPADVATCDTAGVIGPATHLIASLQVAEAMKWITGNHDAIRRDVISIDLWTNQIRSIGISAELSATCPACALGQRDFLNAEVLAAVPAVSLCGRDAVQVAGGDRNIDLTRIANRWRSVGDVQETRFFIRLNLGASQSLTLFRDARAVITGIRDIAHARSLYDRYVGS